MAAGIPSLWTLDFCPVAIALASLAPWAGVVGVSAVGGLIGCLAAYRVSRVRRMRVWLSPELHPGEERQPTDAERNDEQGFEADADPE